MTIRVFGKLKDYFEPVFTLENKVNTIPELRKELIALCPDSDQLLSKCRFAVGNTILGEEESLTNPIEIAVLPPSSGG